MIFDWIASFPPSYQHLDFAFFWRGKGSLLLNYMECWTVNPCFYLLLKKLKGIAFTFYQLIWDVDRWSKLGSIGILFILQVLETWYASNTWLESFNLISFSSNFPAMRLFLWFPHHYNLTQAQPWSTMEKESHSMSQILKSLFHRLCLGKLECDKILT